MDEDAPASFAGQEHLLADGRLDEAVSLALVAAFPEFGAWRTRFEQDRKQPNLVRLSVAVIPARGTPIQGVHLIDGEELLLANWVASIRMAVLACLQQVFAQLEQHLALEPDGKLWRALAQLCKRDHPFVTPLDLVRFYRERLENDGLGLLRGIDARSGGLNLLSEVEADARAELCLVRSLGEEYVGLQRHGHIDIPSRLYPRRVYRVRRGQRIQMLENGRCTAELCMESGIKVPEADEFLMKVVWLRANEHQVLRTANHFPSSRLLL